VGRDQSDNDQTRAVTVIASGTQVGHYRVVEKIGAGGMGEVYLAEDTDLKRQVVLKFLSTDLNRDQSCRERFLREAQAAAKLNHPNIVTIHEVGEHNDRPFIAMEYVQGQTLRDVLQGGILAPEKAGEIACQICQGLSAAHEAGVIHRDIKPANIMLDEKGRVRLLDFGLAKVQCADLPSQVGTTAGTISYMAPEVLTGGSISPATDLFSLGVVLFQMVTGKLPFEGDYEAAVLYAIVNERATRLSEVNPEIPARMSDIIERLLQKDPQERYQSAKQLQEELACRSEITLRDLPEPAHQRWSHAAAYLTLSLFIVAGLIVGYRFFGHGTPKVEPAGTRKVLAVLPFENLGAPEDQYFANGTTDAVAANLACLGELMVISRSSTMLYRGSQKTPRQIGEELGAAYLLTGTIQWDKSQTPNHVRVTTSLVSVARSNDIWAQSYDRVLDKVFAIQTDIGNEVGRALKIAIHRGTEARALSQPTDNLEAYDFYLRGNDYFNRSWELPDIQHATQMYQRAVELDSGFALAYAMLARGHASMYWEHFDRSDYRLQAAQQAAEKALALQPDLAEGHVARGYCYYQGHLDYEHALQEFDTALRNSPSNAEIYNAIAAVMRRQSRLQEAAQNFIKALELDPRSPLKAFDVALTYGMMRRFALSNQYLERAAALAPEWSLVHIYKAWLPIFEDGDVERSRRVLAEASQQADLQRSNYYSKYYWWLLRNVEPDLNRVLAQVRMGSDSAAYYLQIAELSRLLGHREIVKTYADSAYSVLDPKAVQHPDDAQVQSYLGLCYAFLGNQPSALTHGAKALELLPSSRDAFDAPYFIVNLAESEVVFGQYESAIEHLKLLLSVPGFATAQYLKLDPLWKPLAKFPAFQDLLRSKA
jgi:serine/threonine protein kinase/Flp pilus assembly protein TadD